MTNREKQKLAWYFKDYAVGSYSAAIDQIKNEKDLASVRVALRAFGVGDSMKDFFTLKGMQHAGDLCRMLVWELQSERKSAEVSLLIYEPYLRKTIEEIEKMLSMRIAFMRDFISQWENWKPWYRRIL